MALVVTSQGTFIDFSFNGYSWGYYEPVGWSPSDPNSHFHTHWCGNGENNAAEAAAFPPIKQLIAGDWDGKIVKADGTIAKIAIMVCPALGGRTSFDYMQAVDHVISTIGIPTTGEFAWLRFQGSALSGGPARFLRYYLSSSQNGMLFRKKLLMSMTSEVVTQVFFTPLFNDDNDNQFTWLRAIQYDNNTPTAAWVTEQYYRDIYGRKKIELTQHTSHTWAAWSPLLTPTGLNTANGSTAETSAWRYLTDPLDGVAGKVVLSGDIDIV